MTDSIRCRKCRSSQEGTIEPQPHVHANMSLRFVSKGLLLVRCELHQCDVARINLEPWSTVALTNDGEAGRWLVGAAREPAVSAA